LRQEVTYLRRPDVVVNERVELEYAELDRCRSRYVELDLWLARAEALPGSSGT
jgi:hypothetical protein